MPPTAKDIEKRLLKDGWYLVRSNGGSHVQYKHPCKKGKNCAAAQWRFITEYP